MKKVIIFLYLILISVFTYSQVQIKELDEATTLTSGDKFIIQKVTDDVQYTTWGFIDAEIDPPVVDSALVADTAYYVLYDSIASLPDWLDSTHFDTMYVNVTGDTITGVIVFQDTIVLNDSAISKMYQGVILDSTKVQELIDAVDSVSYSDTASVSEYAHQSRGDFTVNDDIFIEDSSISSTVSTGKLFIDGFGDASGDQIVEILDSNGNNLYTIDGDNEHKFGYMSNNDIYVGSDLRFSHLDDLIFSLNPDSEVLGGGDVFINSGHLKNAYLSLDGNNLHIEAGNTSGATGDNNRSGGTLYLKAGKNRANDAGTSGSSDIILQTASADVASEQGDWNDVMKLDRDKRITCYGELDIQDNNIVNINKASGDTADFTTYLNVTEADSADHAVTSEVADSAADAGALQGISNTSNMATDTLYHAGILTPYLNATYAEIDKSVHDSILFDTDEWVITYNAGDTLNIANKTYGGDILQLLPDGGVICNSLQWALEDTSTAANKVYGNQVFNSADSVMYIWGGDDAWHSLW